MLYGIMVPMQYIVIIILYPLQPGDVEFLFDLKTYIQSVVCIQQCEVYTLSAKNYERLVVKRNPQTLEKLRQGVAIKLEARVPRIHDDHHQTSFLNILLRKIRSTDESSNSSDLCVNNERGKRTKRATPETPLPPNLEFPRGPIIDYEAPGTLHHHNKVRELVKLKQNNKRKTPGF